MTSASDKVRINELVNVVMQVASGNYNAQVKLSGTNDDLDSLAMGLNMMIDDIKNSINIEQQNERFKRINRELSQAKKKAEESDKLKSAFLANMSHEIRTPMNGILGFSSLLKEPGLSGKQQSKYIALIEESGARMLEIINDLIDISKVESGQMEIYISEVNISEKVRFIVDFFQPEAEKKGLSLTCSNPKEQSDIIVKSDKAKFNAILTNLVKNAIKYTNKGTIAVSYEQVGDYIHIHVKDTGIGITDSRLNAVFDRFVQADSSISSNYEGAGLGLAISKAFAEMLGGEIWLESKIKVGSRFSFSIPNKRSIQKKKNENYQGTIKDNNAKKKIKILIAEDDLTSDLLLSTLIKEISKEILHATTGKEAIEICKQNPDIDLILMDVRMPEIDGYNATREIRTFNKEVIIIAQTAYALQGEIQKAKDAGCNDFISKPLKKITLLELTNKYFQ